MKLTLLCEMCHVKHFETRLGTFELDDLKWPMDLSIFKSHAPDLLPDPFPVGLEWKDTRCRQCRSRPFLNFIPQQDGTVMLIDGKRAEKGAEGRLLTLEAGYIPIFGYPAGGEPVDPLARLMVDDTVLIPPANTPPIKRIPCLSFPCSPGTIFAQEVFSEAEPSASWLKNGLEP